MRRILLVLALISVAALRLAIASPMLVAPISDVDGSIARAAVAASGGLTWWSIDGHLHTDHSHDAGFPHQQSKRPENHDTYVSDQIGEAERQQMDAITLTDHRTYDQAYDPDYRSTSLLLDGEEWGGYPHATAWGITEQLDEGPDETPVSVCGVARAAREVRAQDAIYGVAHPEDGRRTCIATDTLHDVPIDHLETFRYPHTGFWVSNIQAGNRLVPVTGSDNHFRQLYGTQGGPGASTTFILSSALTKASLVQAVRAGRVISGTRAVGPKLTSYLDADNNGTFETITGGWSVPGGPTVRVAFRVQGGPGHWLEVLNDREEMLAQWPVSGIDTVYAYDVPADGSYIRAQLTNQPIERVSGGFVHDYLSYEDSLRVLSAPLYLSEPSPVENGDQGDALSLSGSASWAGFADVGRNGDIVHAVWQERRAPTYAIAYVRSADGGATWSAPAVITDMGEDARMPAIAVDGSRIVVAYEQKAAGVHGGAIAVRTATDGGAFGAATVIAQAEAARPAIASQAGIDHLAFMQMTSNGYAIYSARIAGGIVSSPVQLSHGLAWDGPLAPHRVPPQPIRHVPAAVHPVIAVSGTNVTVAWEDNREDQTPLRNNTPDDWGIYATHSSDGGATWSTDTRISPRHDRTPPNAADPEKMEGNPARHADLLAASDGTLYAAWQDRNAAGGTSILVSRLAAGVWQTPARASAATNEFAYKPQLSEIAGGVRVVWQQSHSARWSLRSASSMNGAVSFGPESAFTNGSGYAGFPAAAGDTTLWTGERGGVYGVWSRR